MAEEKSLMERNCDNDPRFDNFYKRLNWFRRKGETDKEFAERMGITVSRLRDWKKGRIPGYSCTLALSDVVDVSIVWLWLGWDHHVSPFPDGSTLTAIPRIPYFIRDHGNALEGKIPLIH